ncbi:MAG: endonuclease/exonuclease/phosphatase family protein [bacterium]
MILRRLTSVVRGSPGVATHLQCVPSVLSLAIVLLLTSSCCQHNASSESQFRPSRDEFSVMTYNLKRYCYDDRDHDGQANDSKPEEEIRAVVDIIARVRPHVLAVQEMGAPDLFKDFQSRLAAKGLSYPHTEYIPGSVTNLNNAVLSRYPFASRQSITNDEYTIGDEVMPVRRGYISVDVQVSSAYRFRLMVAHLKSKVYHPAGQTEMRRNEARLLNKHARKDLEEEPGLNLLVVGDLNDTINSAALREVLGSPRQLFDLRPRDTVGDVWSHYWAAREMYERLDYLLVSAGMKPEVVWTKTHVVRDPMMSSASDHRPVVGVFKAREL